MKNHLILAITTFLSLLISVTVFADDVDYVDPEGVRVKLNEDGTIKSIIASAEVELEFGDREDINQSKREAKLIAKAEIAKFLNQKIATNETLEEITKTVIKKTNSSDTKATREKLKIQTVQISNHADEYLKGVVTLLEDINIDKKYVRVEVGTNEKMIKAADSLRDKMNQDSSKDKYKDSPSTKDLKGREIRKSKMYDDF